MNTNYLRNANSALLWAVTLLVRHSSPYNRAIPSAPADTAGQTRLPPGTTEPSPPHQLISMTTVTARTGDSHIPGLFDPAGQEAWESIWQLCSLKIDVFLAHFRDFLRQLLLSKDATIDTLVKGKQKPPLTPETAEKVVSSLNAVAQKGLLGALQLPEKE